MRRRRRDRGGGNSVNTQSWLTTYSDMVTLILTFFVLLYSFSSLDTQKWRNVMISLQGSLGVMEGGPSVLEGFPGDGTGFNGDNIADTGQGEIGASPGHTGQIDEIDEFLKYQEEMKQLEGLQGDLSQYLGEKGLSDSIVLDVEERGLVIRFQDSVLFEKSKADLIPRSREILKEIAGILAATENAIRIEGHTDDLPIHTERFPSNWELSTSRATNVLRFLIQEGLPPEKLSAVGYGEYHPLVPNTSEENRSKNRRVDIVILRESLQKNEPR